MNRLTGRTAIVTGAAQGLGRAIARQYACEGARVMVADIDPDMAEETAGSLRRDGGTALAATVDVADASSVEKLVADTIEQFGQIDILCNNAGILDGFAPILKTSEEVWDRVIGVNLKGCFLVSRAVMPNMLERGAGAIVNIASMAGTIAQAGGLAYTSSKHGVIGLTRQIAADYGRKGIRVNAICPGAMDTEMSSKLMDDMPGVREIVEAVPAGRQGRPEEVAELATYLASDSAGFMHGAAVMIDGGWTIT